MRTNDALIGFSGYVGETLLRQRSFEHLFRSSNIGSLGDNAYSTVVCAAAPAQKWIANKEPENDWKNISRLIEHLDTVKCDRFILISTVDVFGSALDVDEDSEVHETGLHAYGLNRYKLEKFVLSRFPQALVVRLPGLVGPGLRKNVIYDFHHNNNVHLIDCRGVFQFYPMVNLWSDLQRALTLNTSLVHLTAEPVSVAEIAGQCFGLDFSQETQTSPARYNFCSKFGAQWGGPARYQYTKNETLLAIRHYAQSEPRTPKASS